MSFTPPRGAELVEYEWDEDTGVARFVYELKHGDVVAEIEMECPQPSLPKHVGFRGYSK